MPNREESILNDFLNQPIPVQTLDVSGNLSEFTVSQSVSLKLSAAQFALSHEWTFQPVTNSTGFLINKLYVVNSVSPEQTSVKKIKTSVIRFRKSNLVLILQPKF